jgi:hypothetical protein
LGSMGLPQTAQTTGFGFRKNITGLHVKVYSDRSLRSLRESRQAARSETRIP